MKHFLFVFLFLFIPVAKAQEIALVKYSGGGDWYANPTSLPNLIAYCNANVGTEIAPKPITVELSGSALFLYPFIHITGHGNIVFNDTEVKNLRKYLLGGGFLHIDDNYGLDQYVRREMKRVFPELDFMEISKDHTIFKEPYSFPNGIPKIHEHDNKPPQAFGLFKDGKLICLYTYETDLGDGWEDPEVHNNPAETREKALKMGANIINYAFKY
ncbi:MAG: DUF4159 domain-containing protein [Flavobacteriaceae bacterium]